MRIIHVTPRYFPNIGGVETFAKELCEGLFSKGFDISIYTLDQGNGLSSQQYVNGILVKRYRPLVGDPAFIPPPSFLRDLRNEVPAIIHVHNLQTLLPLFVSLVKRKNHYFILQPHYHGYGQTNLRNTLFSFYKSLVPHLILARAQQVIVNSYHEKKMLSHDFPSINNLLLVPQGIPLNELASFKWQPAHPDRILFIGSLRKYKAVDVLLSAFKILVNDERQDMELVIVGDGPEKQRLHKLAIDLEIDSKIIWMHNLSRKQLLLEYSKARVFVSLSSLESFGRVVYEAIAIGLPTVVFGEGVFTEMVNDELAEGIYSLNPECIAKTILSARNPHCRQEINGNIHFQDSKDYINQIAKMYEQVNRIC
jgi:glycosyltransferase involved in cell wall biosynthesis